MRRSFGKLGIIVGTSFAQNVSFTNLKSYQFTADIIYRSGQVAKKLRDITIELKMRW